jgi:DNA-binding SARP family transcriptional activator/tetratricopeptide (TPR) repeat protein
VGVEIHVLGPLSVVTERDLVRLPGGRARTVLAVLALHYGESVSRDRLVDAAWGDEAPVTAATQLQGAISTLRRILPAGMIETDGPAYRLRVAPGELDLAMVEATVDTARAAARAGRLVDAAASYRAGLAAWRGTPFEGLDSAYLARHATRLNESRNTLVEEWARIELALGRPAAVIGGLTDWLAANPLRESVSALVMTALCRAGRQADALAHFRQTRAALHDSLGIEPGPELQDLHRRILAGDPRLMAGPAPDRNEPDTAAATITTSVGGSPAAVPLAQLPPDTADFTGREEFVKHLTGLLAGEAASDRIDQPGGVVRVALVTGIGGVGKTTLAVRVGHLVRARFPDGQVYLNLRAGTAQPITPYQAAGRVLRDLGVPDRAIPAGDDERNAMYRSVLADRRLLIVLDDAQDTAQVRPLLPAGGACAVLVTSRHRMPGLTAARVELDVLDSSEAELLFARVVGHQRTSAEPAAVTDILAACGNLPLAVRVLASRLATRPTWTIASLADRLALPAHRLDELTAEDQQARATFEVSYQALTHQQARAFRLAAIPDLEDIPVGAVTAILDLDQRTAERLAEALVDMNLIGTTGPGRYRYHDLLRLFAREQADRAETPADRAATLSRLLGWYHERTRAATHAARPGLHRITDIVRPFSDAGHARAWLDEQHLNITLTMTQCAQAAGDIRGGPDLETLARMLDQVQWYLRARGHRYEWEQIAGTVLAAATRTGAASAEMTARGNLGLLALLRGNFTLAREQLSQTLDLARATGDRSAQGYTLNRLGLLAHQQSRWREGIDHHRRALSIFTQLDDQHGRCTALVNIGTGHRELREPRQALEMLDAATTLARELGDPETETMVLHHAACCQRDLGNLDEAIAAHQKCLTQTRRLGQREGEAYTLAELGQTHLAAHRPTVAVTHLRQAIDMFRALGDANATAVYNADLGHAHRQAGDRDAATTAWTQALHYFQDRDPAMTDTIRKALEGGAPPARGSDP